MKNKKLFIDFREISEYHRGEGLEALTRELGKRLGLNPAWSGRGPDDGKDLLFTEIINGQLANVKIRWLVSCKDFSESGRAVNETDAGSILDKVKQHNANGFLLVTTTTVTSGLKKVLDGLNKGEIDRIRTHVWDGYSLQLRLLDSSNIDLLKIFFPNSYKRIKTISTPNLVELIDALADKIGIESIVVLAQLKNYISNLSLLSGYNIWPYDEQTAGAIEDTLDILRKKVGFEELANLVNKIEFDAFIVFLDKLFDADTDICFTYIEQIITEATDSSVKLNAYQFFYDHYEPSLEDQVKLASYLDGESIEYVLADNIIIPGIQDAILLNYAEYDLWSDLDCLSSHTYIDEVHIEIIEFEGNLNGSVNFSGNWSLGVILTYDKDEHGTDMSFPGCFSGYCDEDGVVIDSATVDTSKFYE